MERGGIIKHNKDNAPKTGDWKFMKPEVDASKCIGCGTCVNPCPEAVIELIERADGNKKKLAEIDQEYCKGCGVCAAVCPVKAISMRK
ncbi:MAG TPA: 4Fe-4S binding protein [Candidatus Moranbacteria bacterium]|jgi:pyruvate ferredoxin oxidoreductase delta subunit|nr:4Fe-4S binding protein [Candidatus Moranbacteria bacterium]HRY27897.1 4Fe-4S binding protein [Candidatus Moranbacteria bacterium]HSA08368.1 4Fe-4S binding protein [Candidatus Moranbacteria bacterium]